MSEKNYHVEYNELTLKVSAIFNLQKLLELETVDDGNYSSETIYKPAFNEIERCNIKDKILEIVHSINV